MTNIEQKAFNRAGRIIFLVTAAVFLAVVLWPGRSSSVFNQGQEPHIEEGWVYTGTAAASAGECASAQEACVEWCRIIDGQPMPAGGAVCCVHTSKVGDNNFGDCLRRVD